MQIHKKKEWIKEESKHFILKIFIFFIKQKTFLFYCCHIFDRMNMYIGFMRKCCHLSALLTILDYSLGTQQRPFLCLPLSLSFIRSFSVFRCSIDEGGGSGCQDYADWVNSRHMERSGRAPQDPSVCSGQTATPHWKKINPIIPQTHIPLPFSSLPCVPHLCFIHTHTHKTFIRCCYWASLY